ncbi:MAG: sugar ABC transporter substrate-binding protein [Roseitalea sp.]|jgi:ribose transport system substrate-binding protein|uniref:Sugar ABC transporter substrate-binding protein n=1 Tax=Oceaniradius stylonematis TaxID=2184161 RepID=A0A3A8ABJ1_9HYPH|nr:sugar ABC transporter substrate-binding protein [Oceaniradius stylonematis]MBO6552071.1 sugar ABC transporter substrate-binding protein [Roseitalea sp.]MBO6951549.1 sugar ABC transporter substrate-binding protein [Rhizobiaceae bacterium]RNC95979.1 MAG: sugar ABC transporter substrate-binding protein [Oricola sp.]MBO6592605.1 sugar ABC transporter substrate-binding protein [Roseitalea sp.]MBO6598860.1 sugar ABC transporter substrate-binding protein [Roseitalea sp.]
MLKSATKATLAVSLAALATVALAQDYPAPVPLAEGAQAPIDAIAPKNEPFRIAYMPPATEFNYYIAIGEGIKAVAEEEGAEVFMLAPQSGADINGQMGMIQDVLTQDVDAIIFGTHDEFAAAPLLKQAVDKGMAVVMINSDIPNFPTPIHGVVGYSQRNGTHKIADWAIENYGSEPLKVGIIEGQPGYHSTERVGGFLDGIEGNENFEVVVSIDGKWNVEGGNTAGMDILQAHPDLDMIFAANDYMIIGASYAAKALGRSDIVLLGNDGDTSGLEEIAAGNVTATVNTSPFLMGKAAMHATLDALEGTYPGGWIETPTTIEDSEGALAVLQEPEKLFPQPSKEY